MKRKIRLIESELYTLLNGSVKSILNEILIKDKARKFMTFEEYLPIAIQRLSDGESPEEVFDRVYDFREGYAWVELNGKYNFINQNGELINPNQWYNGVGSFHEGFAQVILNGKGWNFINQNGEYLTPNQWFDDIYGFDGGFAWVKLNGKGWNVINQNGEYLTPNQWFDDISSFFGGFALVKLNGKGCNFMNQKGDILSPNQWFDNAYYFYGGFAWVKLNGETYYINVKGELCDENKSFIRNLRESVSERKMDMIIESTLRKYLRK